MNTAGVWDDRDVKETVTAIVLAGGRSERFGSEKASAILAGRPLLAWVVEAAGEVCGRVVVSLAPGQSLPAELAERCAAVVDHHPGEGPLGGIVSALAETDDDLVLVLGCDTPLVRPGLLRLLTDACQGVDAAVPSVGNQPQVLVAAYRRAVMSPRFSAAFEQGVRSVRRALGTDGVRFVDEATLRTADPHLWSFRGCNTPADLAALERDWLERES